MRAPERQPSSDHDFIPFSEIEHVAAINNHLLQAEAAVIKATVSQKVMSSVNEVKGPLWLYFRRKPDEAIENAGGLSVHVPLSEVLVIHWPIKSVLGNRRLHTRLLTDEMIVSGEQHGHLIQDVTLSHNGVSRYMCGMHVFGGEWRQPMDEKPSSDFDTDVPYFSVVPGDNEEPKLELGGFQAMTKIARAASIMIDEGLAEGQTSDSMTAPSMYEGNVYLFGMADDLGDQWYAQEKARDILETIQDIEPTHIGLIG